MWPPEVVYHALKQCSDLTRLRFKGDDFARLPQSPECRSATEREMAIVRADIENTVDPPESGLEPRVQFALVQPEDFP